MNRTARMRFEFSRLAGSLRPFAWYLLIAMVVTTSARAFLVIWQYERVAATGGVAFILFQGIRFDLVLQGLLLAIPLSLTPLLMSFAWARKVWRTVLPVILVAYILFIVFMEIATPSFILEYDLRPNVLFVKYLQYPDEVLSMLISGYRLPIAVAAVVLPGVGMLAWMILRPGAKSMQPVPPLVSLVAVPLLLLVCVIAWRSSFDHRPVNPSNVAFSTDPLVNMLPLSSAYSALYGAYELRREDAAHRYGDISDKDVIAVMREMTGLPVSAFTSKEIPTLHRLPVKPRRHKNLVILLEESMGAQYVGALGGLPLTPNLDKLSEEGIWFTNMYATGTRSIRGIEAVVTGFLPTTAESVVKLGGAQTGFFTLAEFLRREGYATSFIYGGSAQFDNMRRFFVGNGFETIIEQSDFEEPEFAGSWGVSDEDLVREANAYFESLPKDRPFFSLVFTTSNHTPFEYPSGRIEPYNKPAKTRENAIKYADYAIGRFIEAARQSSYWEDTIFLVIADHDSRVGGAELVPLRNYHIPALLIGDDVSPQVIDRVASQVDMVPTLISALGIGTEHPVTGVDLLSDRIAEVPPRAVMQFASNIAYRENDDVVIFQPGKPAMQFVYSNQALVRVDDLDPRLERRALAHVEWPRLAYRNRWYRLPEIEGTRGKGR